MLTFVVMREERSWPETVVTGFKLIAQVFANALARKRTEQALRRKRVKAQYGDKCRGSGPLEHGA